MTSPANAETLTHLAAHHGDFADFRDLMVQTASKVYPGTGNNAKELIDAVLGAIS